MKTVHRAAPPLLLILTLLLASPALHGQGVIPDLARTDNRYDYVIIAPPAYLPTITPLAEFRADHDAMRVGIALSDSIYGTYGTGVEPDSAIKKFILASLTTWSSPPPQYFLFAGDMHAVPSHRVKSPLGPQFNEDSVNIDLWFVIGPSSGGTPLPLAALGRLPAHNSTDLSTMVGKIIAYESAPSAEWNARSIAVADSFDLDRSIWEDGVTSWQNLIRPRWSQTIDLHLRPSSPFYATKEEFRELWNRGAALVMLNGHANWYKFSHESYFTTWDVDSLAENSPLPVCFLLGSQTYERTDTVALAVRLLSAPSKGGIAVVAPTGLAFQGEAQDLLERVARNLATLPGPRLGKAFLNAMREVYFPTMEFIVRWTLFGDPALVVKNSGLADVPGEDGLPSDVVLYPGYPNPFNPATMITFALPGEAEVTLEIYSLLGTKVATLMAGRVPSGVHRVEWNAAACASGVYFCRLSAAGRNATQRLILVR